MCVLAHVRNPNRRTVCIREVEKSLSNSVKQLLKDKIHELGVGEYFEITETEIRSKGRRGDGRGVITFQGMSAHTAESIKSLEGYDCAWVEEAQSLSKRSLDLLLPTIRSDDSEIWFSWNPRFETDPVDVFLRGEGRPHDAIVIEVNFLENPWLTDVLRAEAERCRTGDPESYGHVWLGQYVKFSKAQVFHNWRIVEFETPKDAVLRFGVDWGFSPDPTVLVRCFIDGRRLFIDYEAYEVECEIEDTAILFLTVPQSNLWPVMAASDRPERVRSIRRAGFNATAVPREPHSVQEGVDFLKGFEVIIHTRCPHAAEEFLLYRRKVDPLTGDVLPILEDKNNHVIDALRHAVDPVRRMAIAKPAPPANPVPVAHSWKR